MGPMKEKDLDQIGEAIIETGIDEGKKMGQIYFYPDKV